MDLSSFAKCCVCLEVLSPPSVKTLPCLHSGCTGCINELKEKGPHPLRCPLCRFPFDASLVPSSASSSSPAHSILPANVFAINGLALSYAGLHSDSSSSLMAAQSFATSQVLSPSPDFDPNSLKCEVCEENDAMVYCANCQQYLCSSCQRFHQKQKATASHQFFSVEEAISGPRAPTARLTMCKKHPALEINSYCKVCLECVCSECAIDTHPGHLVTKLSLILEATKNDLLASIEAGKELDSQLNASIQKIGDVMRDVLDEAKAAEEEIKSSLHTLHAELDRRAIELIAEVQAVAEHKNKHLLIQRDDLDFVLVGLRQATLFTTALLDQGTDAEIAGSHLSVKTRFETLLGIPVEHTPTHQKTIKFVCTERQRVVKATKEMGRIYTELESTAPTSSYFVRDLDAVRGMLMQIGSPGIKERYFNGPSGVACNSRGDICVVEYNNHRVQVFDKTGQYLFKFGAQGSGASEFDGPYGIHVDQRNDQMVVSDGGNGRVQVFNDRGVFLLSFGLMGHENGHLMNPRGVCVDPTTGDYYVADMGNHRVQVFSSDGQYLRKFGRPGVADGQLFYPTGIGLLSNGSVVVSECSNSRVQVFSQGGAFLRVFGLGLLFRPWHLSVDSLDNVLVADFGNNRVQTFSRHGDHISSIGQGELRGPTGVCMDRAGRILVAEIVSNRIAVF